jgi:hypothetical protein
MSTPIVEHIALELVALIDAITIAAGFNQDLTAVRPKRLHLEGDINTDGTVIIEQEDGAVEADSDDATMMRQAFTLQALVIDSDDATDPIDTRLNQAAADIIKKLFTGTNWQLGGNAAGMALRNPATEKFIADPQVAGIAVNIDVLYRVATDDPYSKA